MPTGVINFTADHGAYGFIIPDDGAGRVFVSERFLAGFSQGDRVQFNRQKGLRGLYATDVRLANESIKPQIRTYRSPSVEQQRARGVKGVGR